MVEWGQCRKIGVFDGTVKHGESHRGWESFRRILTELIVVSLSGKSQSKGSRISFWLLLTNNYHNFTSKIFKRWPISYREAFSIFPPFPVIFHVKANWWLTCRCHNGKRDRKGVVFIDFLSKSTASIESPRSDRKLLNSHCQHSVAKIQSNYDIINRKLLKLIKIPF